MPFTFLTWYLDGRKGGSTLVSDKSLPLIETVGKYYETLDSKNDHEDLYRELTRFTNWCGPQRSVEDLTPPEIGDYAEQVGGTGTSPQAAERLQIVRTFLRYARKSGFITTNLAIHVRTRKARSRIKGAQVRDAKKAIELTPEGHESLTGELEKLRGERAPLAVQIRKAAADKDVRENAPLEAAREQLGLVESRIATIEETLKDAVIIEAGVQTDVLKVKLGARVSMKDLDTGRESTYMVVSPSEANPLEGKISDASPLGKAFVGRSEGQEVEVQTPRGKTRLRILAISG